MKQSIRLALVSALALVLCLVPGKYTFADSVSVKPFLAFGADLSTKEKAQVMKQFGITNEELADYQTITVTNKEEHQYLDEYLASKVIGTRALSSVMIEEADAGSGIEVETHNISFCSKEMYTNALVTAGISDSNKFSSTRALDSRSRSSSERFKAMPQTEVPSSSFNKERTRCWFKTI